MIDVKQLPQVAVESINEVHAEEVQIVNTLLEALESGADFETVSARLDAVLGHMAEHFAGEEALMIEHRFPMYRLHKGEHDKILQQARYAQTEWRNRKDPEVLREYFEEEIGDWLDQHIKAMDTPLAQFLAERA